MRKRRNKWAKALTDKIFRRRVVQDKRRIAREKGDIDRRLKEYWNSRGGHKYDA